MARLGIWVPVEILQDDNLTVTERFILSEIAQLSSLEDGCYASNNHFASLINITRQSASRAIKTLAEKGYISSEIIAGTRNHSRVIKLIMPSIKTLHPLASKRLETKGNKHNNKQRVPTLAEIEAYIAEKNMLVDANKFFDYFEAGNWKDSNGKQVKNWKQKLITWNNHTKPEEQEQAGGVTW